MTIDIKRFIDSEGRVTILPKKREARLAVLAYIADKFSYDTDYTERQVNEICDRWHTFGDFYLVRRELIDYGYMAREANGSKYWRTEKPEEDKSL